MAQYLQRPKGTQDALPSGINKWHTVEQIVRDCAEQFGFREIRTPVFEETDCTSALWGTPQTLSPRRCIPSPPRATRPLHSALKEPRE